MAKLTSDLQDLRKKDVKALESLVLEIRENQFKNRMKHKTGQLNESHLLTIDKLSAPTSSNKCPLADATFIAPLTTYLLTDAIFF